MGRTIRLDGRICRGCEGFAAWEGCICRGCESFAAWEGCVCRGCEGFAAWEGCVCRGCGGVAAPFAPNKPAAANVKTAIVCFMAHIIANPRSLRKWGKACNLFTLAPHGLKMVSYRH